MARSARSPRLETRNARAKLKAREAPYWQTIGPGHQVGYRKGKKHSTWKARWRNPETDERRQANLGAADDHTGADGVDTLTFWQAQEAARAFFAECERDANNGRDKGAPYTVADAINDYLEDLAHTGGDVDSTRRRAERDILPSLGDVEARKLTGDAIKQWMRDLANTPAKARAKADGTMQYRTTTGGDAQRRRRSSANRTLTILKAALNHAWRTGKVDSDAAWRTVRPFPKADAARVRYLSLDECRRLLNASEPDFRALVRGALLTGCRYGELAALDVADFDRDAAAIHIKDSKSGKARYVYVSDEGMAFFNAQSAGRPADAPMFVKADGTRWGKSHAQRPLARACEAARIDTAITFHELRHTYASQAIMAGAPLMVVATNLGHADTRMVEKHYGHLAHSYVRDTIRKTAPSIGADDAKIVPFTPAAGAR